PPRNGPIGRCRVRLGGGHRDPNRELRHRTGTTPAPRLRADERMTLWINGGANGARVATGSDMCGRSAGTAEALGHEILASTPGLCIGASYYAPCWCGEWDSRS